MILIGFNRHIRPFDLMLNNAKAKSNPVMNYSKSLPLNRSGSGWVIASCSVAECINTNLRTLCLFCVVVKPWELKKDKMLKKDLILLILITVFSNFIHHPVAWDYLKKIKNIHCIWNQDSNPGTSYLSYYLDPDSSSGYYLLLLPIW